MYVKCSFPAIAETASISVDSVVDEMIPIRALKLLTFLLKEIVDVNDRILTHIASEQIVQLIEVSGKTTIDSGRETATFECKRLTEALRIAESKDFQNAIVVLNYSKFLQYLHSFYCVLKIAIFS